MVLQLIDERKAQSMSWPIRLKSRWKQHITSPHRILYAVQQFACSFALIKNSFLSFKK